MNKNKSLLRIVISIMMTCFLCQQGFAQKTASKDVISVTLNIIGYGVTDYYKDKSAGYYAMTTLKNNQDTAISFVIMDCSWARDNWVASNDSIFLGDRGCDANSPIR